MISHISTKLSHQTIFSTFLFFCFIFCKIIGSKFFEYFFLPVVLLFVAVCRLSELLASNAAHRQQWIKKSVEKSWKSISSDSTLFPCCFFLLYPTLSVLFIILFQPTESRLLVEFTMQFYHIPYCSVVVSLAWALLTLWNKKQHITRNQNIFIQNNTWNTKPDNPSQKSTEDIYRSEKATKVTFTCETGQSKEKIQNHSKKRFSLPCWV